VYPDYNWPRLVGRTVDIGLDFAWANGFVSVSHFGFAFALTPNQMRQSDDGGTGSQALQEDPSVSQFKHWQTPGVCGGEARESILFAIGDEC
jgi:hypothetical protein